MIGPDKGWGNSLFALGERRFWRPARTGPAMKLSLCGLCGGNEKTTSCRNGIKTTWRSDGLSWRHLGQRRAEVSPVGSEGLRGRKNGQKCLQNDPKWPKNTENRPKTAFWRRKRPENGRNRGQTTNGANFSNEDEKGEDRRQNSQKPRFKLRNSRKARNGARKSTVEGLWGAKTA